MISGEVLQLVNAVARACRGSSLPFGGVQLVVVGDFYQLSPVDAEKHSFAFESPLWNDAIKTVHVLKSVHRQRTDPAFIKILNELRVGFVSEETAALLKGRELPLLSETGIVPTRLYPLNRDVNEENNSRLRELPGPCRTFTSVDSSEYLVNSESLTQILDRQTNVQSTIHLKIGAQVVLLKNYLPDNLVNGSRGVVVGWDERDSNFPVVKFQNGIVMEVGPARFEAFTYYSGECIREQVPLKLAWALTVHKSQGMTLDLVECHLANVFDYGQVYVALSRVRHLKGLRILDFRPESVKVHPKVEEFYRCLSKEKRKQIQLLKQAQWKQ
ncbi:ATP-dependent DNA helicase PIF1-like [Zophobas morio]